LHDNQSCDRGPVGLGQPKQLRDEKRNYGDGCRSAPNGLPIVGSSSRRSDFVIGPS
jgi:hypothetical protein